MRDFPKPRIVISKCIGFDPCRYNGEIVRDAFVAQLEPHVEFLTVCPEVAIGLGTPRPPIRIVASGGQFKLVQPSTGLDVSDQMRRFSSDFLGSLQDVDGFILKNRSPSCGFSDVKMYSGPEKGPCIGKTAGFFGGAVLDRFGDRAVEDEGRLKNLNIREAFLTRIFALARWRSLKRSASLFQLVQFHAANKLLLMAWNQTKMRELGRIVANRNGISLSETLELYGERFLEAFRNRPRHSSPINVLEHALGYFKKELTAREKKHFLQLLDAYRAGKVPLDGAVILLKSWVLRFENEYLLEQTFFDRFPQDLMNLEDSGKSWRAP